MKRLSASWIRLFIVTLAGGAAIGVGCDKGSSSAPASPTAATATGGGKIKLGYLVKQPDEPWFQTEWQFADKAAAEDGFELIKLPTTDGEKVLSAIDNLAAQGAKGFVICTPDVRLGPAIVAKANETGMKFMTVDDQLLGGDGKFLSDVHHLGVAAREVGHVAGKSLAAQAKSRGWAAGDIGVCLVTFDELDTARERTTGIEEALVEGGIDKGKIFHAPQAKTNVEKSFEAANVLVTQHPEVKCWLVGGMNDTAVLGAVRALEGRGFNATNACGIGINGTDCLDELKKTTATPFYGSILMEANVHGHDTADALYKWVSKGEEPPKARFTGGILITRADFEQKLKEHGMWR